jgi:hypothetical protein
MVLFRSTLCLLDKPPDVSCRLGKLLGSEELKAELVAQDGQPGSANREPSILPKSRRRKTNRSRPLAALDGAGVVCSGQFSGGWSVSDSATVEGSSCGRGGRGHVYQMIVANNFVPGNAGVIFYADIGITIIGLVFLWLQHRLGCESLSPDRAQDEALGA